MDSNQNCCGGCQGCPGCPGAQQCQGCPCEQQCQGCPGAQQCQGCPGAQQCQGCPCEQQCSGCPGAQQCQGCPGGCCQNQEAKACAGGCDCGCADSGVCACEDECGCGCPKPEEKTCAGGCCCGCEDEKGYKTYGQDEDGYEYLTEDGGVKKKILKEGKGDLPVPNTKSTVHYDGYLYPSGEEFDSSRKRHSPFTFTLGKGEVIKAWDIGIATIRRGEKASLICAPEYAYGESGSPPTIGKNATLRFEIEGLNFEPPHMTIAERIESATEAKGEGNNFFKEKKYEEAIESYQNGLKAISYRWGATPIESKNLETLLVVLNSNLAMCYLKINSLNDAVNCCKEALKIDSFNTKALYRLSEAYIGLSEFKEANDVINKCLEINPDDQLFKRQSLICKKKEQQIKNKEKKLYSKMFN